MSAVESEVTVRRCPPSSRRGDPMLPLGTNRCRCSGCAEYFGGVRAFDMHRQGEGAERVCLPPGGVSDGHGRPKLQKNQKGYWCRSGPSSTTRPASSLKTRLRVVRISD